MSIPQVPVTRIYGESKIIGGSTIVPEDFWWNTKKLCPDEDFQWPKIFGAKIFGVQRFMVPVSKSFGVKDLWCPKDFQLMLLKMFTHVSPKASRGFV